METPSNPTPQPSAGRPDEIVSSDSSPTVRTRRSGLRGVSSTVWSVLAVVVVLVGGVTFIHWSNRSEEPPVQDSSLSGFRMTLPEPASSTERATDRPTTHPGKSPFPSKSKKDTEGTGDASPPPSTRSGAGSGGHSGAPAQTNPATTTAESSSTAPADVPVTDAGPDVADPSVNLAASGSMQASSQLLGHSASSAIDGSQDTYWESLAGFPQTLTLDLGKLTTVGRLTMALPQGGLWGRRTQVIAVQGSSDGSDFHQLSGAQSYRFGGRHGSGDAGVGFARSEIRYLRLTFTENSGWPAAQLGQLAAYSS